MNTLIYMEMQDGRVAGSSLELISVAAKLGPAKAVIAGNKIREAADLAAGYGIETIAFEMPDSGELCQDMILALLEQTVAADPYELILFSATQSGKDLAPRLAARMKTGCVTDVTAIDAGAEAVRFIRPAYGGTILETMEFAAGRPMVVSVRAGSFKKPEAGAGGRVIVKDIEIPADAVRVRLVDTVVEIAEKVDLESAEVIVAGGRGCGSSEVFQLVKELAALLGGVVGASRPAIEEGWISRAHQVGQSGKIVTPKLYIACGISGAMQHVSGMAGADYIVAINKDEEAPIFEVSDISIVGRCEDILPVMIAEIRKLRA